MWRVVGLHDTGRYGVHDNCLGNVLRGVQERVFFRVGKDSVRPPVEPLPGAFETCLGPLREQLAAVTPKIRRVTRQQFVEMYKGRKREIYQHAADSLAVRPVNIADSYVSTFVKCEKIDFRTKPDPAPRVIQPRSPRYNVEVGRFLKAQEKSVVKGIAEIWGGPTVMKGMNAREQGEALREMWLEFRRPVAVGLDATRFDQHVSRAALEFEHSCYLAMCPENSRPRLAELLAMQQVNRGFARVADGVVKYLVEGRRMSGDMNTGLGNCLLMSLMVLGLRRKLGWKMRLANNGDDCVIICEAKRYPELSMHIGEWFRQFGFEVEVEAPVYNFEEISFCQTQPVWSDGWVMCRDPRVVMDKDLVSVLDLGYGAATWAHAVGECGLSLASGLPVLQEFYCMLLRHGKPGNARNHPWMDSGFARLAAGLEAKVTDVSPEARYRFYLAFGILPDMQVAMEQELQKFSLAFSAGEVNPTLSQVPLTWLTEQNGQE